MPIKVSVYGTLLSGFGNNRLLKDSKLLGESTVKGTMYSYGPYPYVALTHYDKIGDVKVEVWEVDEPTLRRLDGLEGYPDFYDRSLVTTKDFGETWIYNIEKRGNSPHVKSGSWREFTKKEEGVAA